MDVNSSLKEALNDTLSGLLCPDPNVRLEAEARIKALEVTEAFGVHLAELTIDASVVSCKRQLSSVLLKQYVDIHWCNYAENFRPPETSDGAKAVIKDLLPEGLGEPITNVRSCIAYAITAIAHWEWPEHWPRLLEVIVDKLTGHDIISVRGALQVLVEFCNDLSDTQLPYVAPVIFSQMYRIFQEEQRYDLRIRAKTIEIFSSCAFLTTATKDADTVNLLNPVIPAITGRFVHALVTGNGPHSDLGLKMDIVKALTLLLKRAPKQMAPWLDHILPPVWKLLIETSDTYYWSNVLEAEIVDEVIDSDGNDVGIDRLIMTIFEFVHTLVECRKFCKTLKTALTDLLYYLIVFSEITEEQVRTWNSNPNQFVEDEDEQPFAYSVRISAQELILTLCEEFDDVSCLALSQATAKHMERNQSYRNAGGMQWWKTHEACMLAAGTVKGIVASNVTSEDGHFDLQGFLQNIVLADMSLTEFPFLVGRCLWFGSRFAHFLSKPALNQFLQTTAACVQPDQTPCLLISATRAVWVFSEQLKFSGKEELLSVFPRIMENFIYLTTHTTSEVLCLVLEAMTYVLEVDQQFTASCEQKVTPLTIALFLRFNSDPIVISLALDLFQALSENPQCLRPLQAKIVPTLVSILNAPPDRIPDGMHAVALDVLTTLVRHSSCPLSELLMDSAFPAALQCVLKTDDNSTMQGGGECLRTYVSKAPHQVCNHHDNEGHSGLWYILQVTALLLNPSSSEYTATFVGRLLITLITKAGDILGENLDLLLKGVLSKMQRASTLSVIQSLVMVYAHLLLSQMESVLNFLSTVPGPMGQSALQFVLTTWCARQHLFFGDYERKVSTVALTRLLRYGATSNDPRLGDISVPGDEIVAEGVGGIQTRSRTQSEPKQWTLIPLLVKILKLLINELSCAIEANTAADMEDETDEDQPEADERARLHLPTAGAGSSDEAEDGDQDVLNDPVYSMNIQQFLVEYLQSFSQEPFFPAFAQHFNFQERQILASVGIGI